VATTTEIYDYLRLLFARAGVTFCPNCQVEVHKDSVDEIADRVLAHQPIGRKFYILFEVRPTTVETKARPVGSLALPARLGEKKRAERPARAKSPSTDGGAEALKARLFSLRQIGFNRLYQDGRVFEFSNPESLLDIDFSRPVFILVDRLAISPDIRQRLIDSLELCYRETGEAVLEIVGEAAKPLRTRNRVSSPSTTLTALARAVRVLATRLISTSTGLFRTRERLSGAARWSLGRSRATAPSRPR